MLYDPKWEKKVADPLALECIIAWLATMPADQKYNYGDICGACLYSQYLVGLGYESGIKDAHSSRQLWKDLHNPQTIGVACDRPWTFGAALERARAVIAE